MPELLIKNLNEQLVSEYDAIFNYLYHSARIQNDSIRKLFVDFSRQELEHARMLIRYILNLCGQPFFIMPKVNQGQDEIQVLILSIAADESAVAKYSMIRQILDNPEYKEIIDRTIEEEKAHYRKLQEMLEKVKETYKARTGEKQA